LHPSEQATQLRWMHPHFMVTDGPNCALRLSSER
jgi:hypothetical protein